MTVYRNTLIATGFAAAIATGAAIGVAIADQPHMHDALDRLHQARHQLEIADHDKGGHREIALGYVDQAIHEVEEGIRYDRHH